MPNASLPSMPRAVRVLLLLLYAPVVVYIGSKGPLRAIDSSSYWEMSPIRSPGYPLFLQPFLKAGPLLQSDSLHLVQLALGAFATWVICRYLKRRFELPFGFAWALSWLFLYPYLAGEFANQILSEALAYPLFLLVMRFFLPAVLDRSPRDLAIASALTIPLVLTRGQFLFLYPLIGLVALWLVIVLRERRKPALGALLIAGLCIAATGLLERGYHALVHGEFVATPYTGIHLTALPFYCATTGDAERFEDPTQREFFEQTFAELRDGKLTWASFERSLGPQGTVSRRGGPRGGKGAKGKEDRAGRGQQQRAPQNDPQQTEGFRGFRKTFRNFAQNFEVIVHQVIKRRARMFDETQGIAGWMDVDELTTSTARTLIAANPTRYAQHYLMNVFEGVGRRQFGGFFLITSLAACWIALRRRHAVAILVATGGILALANVALIALVQPTHVFRYTCYGDVMLCTGILIAAYHGLHDRFHSTRSDESMDSD